MVTLFSYRRGNSILHKTPALVKLAILITLCIVTFKGGSYNYLIEITALPVIIRTSICFAISVALFILAKSKLKSLKQLNFVYVLGALMILFRMIRLPQFITAEETQNSFIVKVFPFLYLDIDGLAAGVLYTIRFFITTLAANVIFETTSVLEIKEALESIQDFISKIIPPFKKLNLALVISLAINFIPQIFSTWNQVHLASIARSNPQNKNLAQSIHNASQQLQTLFSCLLYQAEEKRKAILNRS